jgi:hypothetical protein
MLSVHHILSGGKIMNRGNATIAPETAVADASSEFALAPGPAKALVISCSDNLFLWPVTQFLERKFGLTMERGNYFPIYAPGGPLALAEPTLMQDAFDTKWSEVTLAFEKKPTIDTVIVINHDGCQGYAGLYEKHSARFLPAGETMQSRQRRDAVSILSRMERHADRKLATYAYFTCGSQFHLVE